MLGDELLSSAMRRTLALAGRGPAGDLNPRVGCVLLDPEGRIVAEGWHRGSGTAHAEVDALAHLPAEWRGRGDELTAVVSLEPCNHTGRTGPCARALIDAGIGAVAYGLDDPGDASAGGAATLREAGVAVRGGLLAGEVRASVEDWLAAQERSRVEADGSASAGAAPVGAPVSPRPRPRVIAKWAQTLDGRAAAADGSSQWITGPAARADVHRRRAEADAILVGTGTLLADDPSLTARDAAGELLVPDDTQPIPVILGHRPTPVGARVDAHPALAARGLEAPIRISGEHLAADLASLAERGIRSVFVEGGPTVVSALLAAGLVDELLVYVAPALLGGPRHAIADIGVSNMAGILRLATVERIPLGPDLLIRAIIEPRTEVL